MIAIKQGLLKRNIQLQMAGWIMPYLAVWLGLFIFRNAWAAVLGYHLGIIILVTLGNAWNPVEWLRPNESIAKNILFGSMGCLAGLAVLLLWPTMQVSPALKTSLIEWGLDGWAWIPFIVYSTLINPWLEEIYWRKWLGSQDVHLVVTDAAFAGFHLIVLAPFFPFFWLAVTFLILAASSWMWRQVNRRENSILASTLFHMCADVSILLVIWSTLGR